MKVIFWRQFTSTHPFIGKQITSISSCLTTYFSHFLLSLEYLIIHEFYIGIDCESAFNFVGVTI